MGVLKRYKDNDFINEMLHFIMKKHVMFVIYSRKNSHSK